jgi:hypothetical protein
MIRFWNGAITPGVSNYNSTADLSRINLLEPDAVV